MQGSKYMESDGSMAASARDDENPPPAHYCRVCVDNLHRLQRGVLDIQCGGKAHSALESFPCAVERLTRAMESHTQCSGKLYFT